MTTPASAQQRFEQALAHWRSGRPGDAEACFRTLLAAFPEHGEGHHRYGMLLAQAGNAAAALDHLARAEALLPGRADVRINCASVHQHAGQFDQALRRLEALRADGVRLPELFFNLGVVLQALERFSEAAAAFAEAHALRAEWPEAWLGEGHCLLTAGGPEPALRVLTEARRLFPDHAAIASNALLAMNYCASVSTVELLRAHRDWGSAAVAQAAAAAGRSSRSAAGKPPKQSSKRPPKRPLRLGFVSPNLAEHSVAYFLEPLLDHLDRARFDCVAYSGAPEGAADAVTARLRARFSRWRTVVQLDDATLARRIGDDGIDVLVDLAGHTARNRLPLFARRLASLQISMIGYPATTGLPSMDYCLTDATLDPAGKDSVPGALQETDEKPNAEARREPPQEPFQERHQETGPAYVERVHRLPLFCCYRPPELAPEVGEPPLCTRGAPTFGSFQTLGKLSDPTLALWAALLREVPSARLSIKALGGRDPAAVEQLLGRFARLGVATPRITISGFSGFPDFLAAHREIDLCLDTLPWNGHTTTCHALWMGVPTLTQVGDRRAGRMGKALMEAVGLRPFVVEPGADFAAAGRALVASSSAVAALAALRGELRQRLLASPLCDGQAYANRFMMFVERALAPQPR